MDIPNIPAIRNHDLPVKSRLTNKPPGSATVNATEANAALSAGANASTLITLTTEPLT